MKRIVCAQALLLATVLLVQTAGPAGAATHIHASDFNGDGFADVADGIPFESTAGEHGGAVSVLYGGVDGVSSTGNQLWRPTSSGLDWGDQATSYAEFGWETAEGDFDGDKYGD